MRPKFRLAFSLNRAVVFSFMGELEQHVADWSATQRATEAREARATRATERDLTTREETLTGVLEHLRRDQSAVRIEIDTHHTHTGWVQHLGDDFVTLESEGSWRTTLLLRSIVSISLRSIDRPPQQHHIELRDPRILSASTMLGALEEVCERRLPARIGLRGSESTYAGHITVVGDELGRLVLSEFNRSELIFPLRRLSAVTYELGG